MTLDKTRAHIAASVWKAIAQSEVDLSAVPREQQEILVQSIANNLLLTVDEILDQASASDAGAHDEPMDDDEEIRWEGRPFLALGESYRITNERIQVRKGIINRLVENYELIRVQDLDYTQKFSERLFGIGDIQVRGQDPSTPQIVLRDVRDPEKVYEIIRKAWLEARKRHGLLFHEEM